MASGNMIFMVSGFGLKHSAKRMVQSVKNVEALRYALCAF
jgi:hypothetical protein